MPKKEKTLKELQAENEALSKQNFDLHKQNLILTIQNEYIKIRCLSFGKRRARKQEIAQAVTELRQELKCSVSFILQAAIEEYIDYYNNRRIQVNLRGLTPCEQGLKP